MKIIVVMPAYNAAKTIEKTYRDIPAGSVSDIVLGDDCSTDRTVEIAKRLGLRVLKTERNSGYGGNQKMLYREALARGADVVVMLHPDWQYDATKIPALVAPILRGEKDLMMGSRLLGGKDGTLAGGMPLYKYISNRFLSFIEEFTFRLHLSEYHSGFRAYSRKVLTSLPIERFSNDFVFDTELLAGVAALNLPAGEIAVPCRYFPEASEINFRRSLIYGLATLWACVKHVLKPKNRDRA
ncbi:MAG: glycosyltransferase family 2 protein [Candidatus Margulisbacteria bacterium]|nr:glycosyltransferase family 2 protein [Candidatus Margulisiibacteriota bacterium]MBU1617591.1 glycosyltransferase family 2 protein [Candidatus Margulisiibacteriota bacterium]